MTDIAKTISSIHFAPFQFFFLGIFLLLLITAVRSKASLHDLFDAVNSIDQNPMAIIVLVIGCIMLIESKLYGFGENAADIIIGYGGGLLQGQLKRELTTRVTNASGDVTATSVSSTPVPPPASNPTVPEVPNADKPSN
jgi:hypothetical protein